MKIDLFDGLDQISVPTRQIIDAIDQLRRVADRLEREEIPPRKGVTEPIYGYVVQGNRYRVAPTFPEAVEKAVVELKDPDAGYRVIPIYRLMPKEEQT